MALRNHPNNIPTESTRKINSALEIENAQKRNQMSTIAVFCSVNIKTKNNNDKPVISLICIIRLPFCDKATLSFYG